LEAGRERSKQILSSSIDGCVKIWTLKAKPEGIQNAWIIELIYTVRNFLRRGIDFQMMERGGKTKFKNKICFIRGDYEKRKKCVTSGFILQKELK